jgi:DNA-binding transcriptional regulator YiaG
MMNSLEIKEIREKLGLTQEALAHILGVSFQTINRWERGLFSPSPLALEKLKRLQEKGEANERN